MSGGPQIAFAVSDDDATGMVNKTVIDVPAYNGGSLENGVFVTTDENADYFGDPIPTNDGYHEKRNKYI